MSENDRLYRRMLEARRAKPADSSDLRSNLADILETVRRCEAMWALEERIEKGRRG